MRKDKIILLAALVSTVCMTTIAINNLSQTINEKTQTINQLKADSQDVNDRIAEILLENESLSTTISDLENELNAKSEELELARRDIEKYTAITSFSSSNVTQKSNATIVHMKRALKGTELYSLANAFVDAEEKHGVNAYFIAAICAQESAWGTSQRAKTQNNLTGHAVYSRGAKGTYFDSKYSSIMSTAKLLKEEYLTPSGSCYNGLSAIDVNQKYCFLEDKKTVDFNWSSSISEIATQLKDAANNF